jgi:hypothetical protein
VQWTTEMTLPPPAAAMPMLGLALGVAGPRAPMAIHMALAAIALAGLLICVARRRCVPVRMQERPK